MFVLLPDHKGEVITIQGLIDWGCTHSIVLINCVYQAYGGVFKVSKTAQVNLLFPEILTSRKVEAPYNMIVGADLLTELLMVLKFSNQTIVWDDLTAPMETKHNRYHEGELAYVLATEVPILKLTKEQQNRILDANYKAIDLDAKINATN